MKVHKGKNITDTWKDVRTEKKSKNDTQRTQRFTKEKVKMEKELNVDTEARSRERRGGRGRRGKCARQGVAGPGILSLLSN
jgi:hypothetical protein